MNFRLHINQKTKLDSYLIEAHDVLGPAAGEDRGEDGFLVKRRETSQASKNTVASDLKTILMLFKDSPNTGD